MTFIRLRNIATFFLVCVCGGSAPAAAQEVLAIVGGRVVTMADETLEKGTVLIRDGKIVAVGADVKVPLEAKVIDAAGKTVMPGLVDPHASAVLSQSNERNANIPYISVVDGIDPSRTYFENSRRNGVTTILASAGNSTMIGGQSAAVKSAGTYVDDMLLVRHAAMKLSMQPASGGRLAHYANMRLEFERAKRGEFKADEEKKSDDAKEEKDAEGNDAESSSSSGSSSSSSAAEQTRKLKADAFEAMMAGKLPVMIYCGNPVDVRQAIKLVKDYQLKACLVLGGDAYEAAELIAEQKLPVILDPTLVVWKKDERTGEDEKIVVPAHLAKHGIKMAVQVSGSSSDTLGSNYMWYQAAIAVKYGMPRSDALRMITLGAAEITGLEKFVGSLEVGKDGDVVVLSGDPLDVSTWVDYTIVSGKVAYDREQDEQFKELLVPPAQ